MSGTGAIDRRADDLVPAATGGWFWPVLWDHRRYFGEAIALSAVINLLSLAGIIFMMTVYDRILPNQAFVTLWSLFVGVVLAMLFEFIARTVRGHALDSAGKRIDVLLGDAVFRRVLGTRLEARSQSSGAFANVLKEFESVRAFVTSATLAALADLPFAMLFLGVTALIGGPLVAVPLTAFALVAIVSLIVQIPMKRIANENLRESAVRHGTVIESLEGLETLKTLRAEERMRARHEQSSRVIAERTMRSQSLSTLVLNLTTMVQQTAGAVLLLWGVYLASEGAVTAGALIACVQLNSRSLAPLVSLSSLAVRFQQARSALASLDRIMQLPAEREEGRDLLTGSHWQGGLRLAEVGFSYEEDGRPVLSGMSLSIAPGERVGVIGRVGSGKSTLLRLLAGLYRPREGQIFLDGVDMSAIEPGDQRATIALVGQDARLFHGSLKENVAIAAPDVDDERLLKVAEETGVVAIAAAHPHGFDRPIGERGDTVSGGQRQAVALARALLARPKLLLLDEPTSAMDQASEAEMLATIRRAADEGMGLVIATHRQAALGIVDRLIVVDNGRIVADGGRDEVITALAEGKVRSAA
ncbi:type I secretion system permease/ATPase [Sphingopyxis flava]|uniref:ATP-binding cassette, subfamily C, LapB n=1 Tax=Sphingopyxis flava TaxID=1507287 RepID=A0A1T5A4I9_9SPHN|nr:type I secretion system permease/ATPase [Sphingopyxis flava]SKB29868.1 ATP-binding cassette, subfamily C, LapB [Sphingopyxis flava]